TSITTKGATVGELSDRTYPESMTNVERITDPSEEKSEKECGSQPFKTMPSPLLLSDECSQQ
ncbi:MAG: hypothetical protein ACE5I8_05140, partial [Thermodesulfobacteriota bacterium]